jgi:hypothetical protein
MAGHKTWAIGEEVISADFNPIIADQVACVFASAAARTAAWPTPPTGALSIRLDSLPNVEMFNGTAWVAITPTTWVTVAQITLAADGPISFPAIPGGYRDLQINATLKAATAGATDSILLRCNTDSGANYFDGQLAGSSTPSAAGSGGARTGGAIVGPCDANGGTATRFSVHRIDVPDYANATRQKMGMAQHALAEAGISYMGVATWLWLNTAAITQLDLVVQSNGSLNFKAGSRATLMGKL